MVGDAVQQHYGRHGLEDAILEVLGGEPLERLSPERAGRLEELHSRGRQATAELAGLADLAAGMRVLDVGCGLGAAARHLADAYDVSVSGIDLTPECVRVARRLTERAGLSPRVTFHAGNALSAPFATATFDRVWLQHVLMNVADKARLFAELRRLLKPGGRLVMHEVVASDANHLTYPLPWARTPATSFPPTPERLEIAIESAGFERLVWRETTALAAAWYGELLQRATADEGSAGLHRLLGCGALDMLRHLADNLREGRLGVVMAVFARTA
jgi:SAM-dependent methyltransferase